MKQELISQYRASLKMLINTIAKCPDELWHTTSYQSPYWQIVYHALHFTNLYLSEDEASFSSWTDHRPGVDELGTLGNSTSGAAHECYTKTDLQDYTEQILSALDFIIDRQDLAAPSGFEWLPMNKLELHIYNLRHLQHHIGQLVQRLHGAGVQGIHWIESAH